MTRFGYALSSEEHRPADLVRNAKELPLPMHFEQAAGNVTPEALAEAMPVGPDPERYLQSIREMTDAGVDHVYVHQVGPDQAGFMEFWQRELQPELPRAAGRQPVGAR